jgi:hypothetical protein
MQRGSSQKAYPGVKSKRDKPSIICVKRGLRRNTSYYLYSPVPLASYTDERRVTKPPNAVFKTYGGAARWNTRWMPPDISAARTDVDGLRDLGPLWAQLHQHHREVSAYSALVADAELSWAR